MFPVLATVSSNYAVVTNLPQKSQRWINQSMFFCSYDMSKVVNPSKFLLKDLKNRDSLSGFCDSKEDRLDNFIWVSHCFSQKMTIATSAHLSLIRSNHMALLSWKEDKFTWKEKWTKYWPVQTMLTSVLLVTRWLLHFVPMMKVLILYIWQNIQSFIYLS